MIVLNTYSYEGQYSQIAVGYSYACALQFNGEINCFGMDGNENLYGELNAQKDHLYQSKVENIIVVHYETVVVSLVGDEMMLDKVMPSKVCIKTFR